MNVLTDRPIRDRYDRFVRRARLSVSAGAPRHRLAFAMEEALRLVSLPGEDHGRTYYFRSLRVSALPPQGDRGVWLERFQHALEHQATQAVHGTDARANLADAVFFHSEHEILETLLHRTLDRRPTQEWYWRLVTADTFGTNAPSIPAIVERLRAQPASWVAVASAIFAEPGFNAARLLRSIPPATIQDWLVEMDGPRPRFSGVDLALTDREWRGRPAIERAMRDRGHDDAGVLWLSALAVLLHSPSDLAARSTVWRARATVRHLAEERGLFSAETGLSLESVLFPAKRPLAFPGEAETSPAQLAPADFPDNPIDPLLVAPTTPNSVKSPDTLDSDRRLNESGLELSTDHAAPLASETVTPESQRAWLLLGVNTEAAGLFFLLNAMRCIGISEACAAGLVIPNFAVRVLQSLLAQSAMAGDDPVALWLHSSIPAPRMPFDAMSFEASWWPNNMLPSPHISTLQAFIRVWSVAVRRWCWRHAGVSVKEIVLRDGMFFVNRTDLDVSLSIDAADVRIRKVGMDLDPGWLPWFGRVVRFHYLFRGEFNG
jgi:hypothetical protein